MTNVCPKEDYIRNLLTGMGRLVQIEKLYHPSNQCIGKGRDPDGSRKVQIIPVSKRIANSPSPVDENGIGP